MSWGPADIPDLRGRIFVVTGGNTGIGYATVCALAARRATVVLGCRSMANAERAVETIRLRDAAADVRARSLDLASLGSVREFAAQLAVELPCIDALINNAGVMMTPQSRTVDGFELQFGTNMLGHFALTGLMLPLLLKSRAARVVTLSSLGHWFGRIDFDNLGAEKRYHKTLTYAQSKLANLVFAYELQRRFDRAQYKTLSIGVHPGVTHSDLARHARWVDLVMRVYGQSIHEGALPSLMAAVDPAIRGGDYVGPGGFLTFKGPPRRQRSSRRSRDAGLGERLWQAAQDLTGVRYLNA